jgi:hypothetical protein
MQAGVLAGAPDEVELVAFGVSHDLPAVAGVDVLGAGGAEAEGEGDRLVLGIRRRMQVEVQAVLHLLLIRDAGEVHSHPAAVQLKRGNAETYATVASSLDLPRGHRAPTGSDCSGLGNRYGGRWSGGAAACADGQS